VTRRAPGPLATLRIIGLSVVGLAVGIVGSFVQATRAIVPLPSGQVVVPWGMILVLVTVVLVIRGAAWLIGSRAGGWAVFAGWLVATVVMAAESPSGDLAISGGGRQMTYLLGGVILGAAAATFPVLGRSSHTIDGVGPLSNEPPH
jgi:hypothetical protein